MPSSNSDEENKSADCGNSQEKKRRSIIQAIMKDPGLTETERRRSIQSIMDGRRRSSGRGSSMAAAAAAVAAALGNETDLSDDEISNTRASTSSTLSGASGSTHRSSRAEGRNSFNSDDSVLMHSIHKRELQPSPINPYPFAKNQVQQTNNFDQDAIHNKVLASYGYGSKFILSHNAEKMECNRQQCNHYQRNCSMIAPCCGLLVSCRVCHDEMSEMPPPLFEKYKCRTAEDYSLTASQIVVEEESKMNVANNSDNSNFFVEDEESNHKIDRFSVTEVVCRKCYTRQSSKSNKCIKCAVQFGDYHCMTCNLWMSTEGEPYHCYDCGFCRVGGRSNFKHCHDCGMCIDVNVFDDHGCKSGKYKINCPVCQEDLFSSRSASHEMPCGHAIHWHCFQELTGFDSRCPICKKTADTRENMEPTWKAMEVAIALQPIPPELTKVVTIKCIDCEHIEEMRSWHFLGNRCKQCRSFNTTVEKTLYSGKEAVDFLWERQNQNNNLVHNVNMDQSSQPRYPLNPSTVVSDENSMSVDQPANRQSGLLEEWSVPPSSPNNTDETSRANAEGTQRNEPSNGRNFSIRRVLWSRR